MSPLEKYQKSLLKLRRLFRFIGQDIFVEANKFRYGKFFFVYLLCWIFGLSVHIVDVVIMLDTGWSSRFAQICILFGICEADIKYCMQKDLQPLHEILKYFDVHIYGRNAKRNDKYYVVCQHAAAAGKKLLKWAAILSTTIFSLINASALIESCLTKMPMFYWYIPMVHEYSWWQLIFPDAFMLFRSFLLIFAVPSGDTLIAFVLINFEILPEIIDLETKELSMRLERKWASAAEVKRRLLDFLRIHQKFNE